MQEKNSRRPLSLAALIAAMTVFGTIGLVRRYIDLGSGTVALFRGAIGSLMLLLGLIFRKNRAPWRLILEKLLPLFLSGAAIGFNWILLFEAYNQTTVAVATVCYYMAPVFALVASAVIFRERLTVRRAFFLLLAIIGMILTSGLLEGGTANLFGVLLGLGAALLYGSVIIANRMLSEVPAYERTLCQLAFATLVLLPYVLLFEDVGAVAALSPSTLVLLIVAGVVHTGIAYVLYFFSVGTLSTSTVALFGYLDPTVAILLSALVLQDPLSPLGIVGAVTVILSAVLGELSPPPNDPKEPEPDRFVPFGRQWIFPIFKPFFRLFFRKPRVVNLSGEILLPARSILVANHYAKRGPMAYELFLPTYYRPWGAYQMLCGYKMRFAYLRDVFYIQKRGFGPLLSTILAGFEACFSILLYRGMKVIPSYPDSRFVKTIHQSIATLEAGMSVLVFPENSSDGYHEELTEFFPGFVALGEHYYRKTGEDLPVYPIYYDEKKRSLVIGRAAYIGAMLNEGMTRKEIADEFCHKVNALIPIKKR